MTHDIELGKLAPADAQRDATHVACVPMVAAEDMVPGKHVGALEVGLASANTDNPIGIVDPFLTKRVFKGERFWLFLYPRTVTGLRHHYDHPILDALPTPASTAKEASEKWLREYATEIGDSYEDLMEGAATWVRRGDHYYGPDTHGYHGQFEGVSTDPKFWEHYDIVTETHTDTDSRGNFFTCSC